MHFYSLMLSNKNSYKLLLKSKIKILQFIKSINPSSKIKISNNQINNTIKQTTKIKSLLIKTWLKRESNNLNKKANNCLLQWSKKKLKISLNKLYWNRKIIFKIKITKINYLQSKENSTNSRLFNNIKKIMMTYLVKWNPKLKNLFKAYGTILKKWTKLMCF